MAQITPNMNLTVWNLNTDPYNHQQLADNFIKLDQHDHSGNGRGSQIDGTSGIKKGTIGTNQLAPNSVTSAVIASKSIKTESINNGAVTGDKIKNGSITQDKIVDGSITTSKIAKNAITKEKLANNITSTYVSVTKLADLKSPENGDEYYYAVDATKSTVWHIRYNSTNAKWEFLGGPPRIASQSNKLVEFKVSPQDKPEDKNMKAVTYMNLPAGQYLVTGHVHFDAKIQVSENTPQIRAGFTQHDSNDLTTSSIKKNTDPYTLLKGHARRTYEFTRQSDDYPNPNEQGVITVSTIVTITNATLPLRFFVGRNQSITTAKFDNAILTATPIYLK